MVSSLQIVIADAYCIPRSQCHTVNPRKVEKYQSYLRSAAGRLEKFLDDMERQRAVSLSRGVKYVD